MQLKAVVIIAAVALILSPTLRGRSPSGKKATVISPINTPVTGADAAFAADGSLWYGSPPTRNLRRSHEVKASQPRSEMLPVSLPVQSNDARDLGAGKLLVASRDLTDPNFAEAVVLLVHYDAQGVVGLILNRRTHVPLSRVLDGLEAAKDRSDPIYLGGPVDTPAVFALYQSPAKLEEAEHVFGRVYLILTKTLLEQTISARPDAGVFHVYLGYAGWTIDQLRREVALGAWFVFPADAGTVFNSDPDSLWRQMIQKTELKVASKGPRSHAAPFVEVGHQRSQLGHRP